MDQQALNFAFEGHSNAPLVRGTFMGTTAKAQGTMASAVGAVGLGAVGSF